MSDCLLEREKRIVCGNDVFCVFILHFLKVSASCTIKMCTPIILSQANHSFDSKLASVSKDFTQDHFKSLHCFGSLWAYLPKSYHFTLSHSTVHSYSEWPEAQDQNLIWKIKWFEGHSVLCGTWILNAVSGAPVPRASLTLCFSPWWGLDASHTPSCPLKSLELVGNFRSCNVIRPLDGDLWSYITKFPFTPWVGKMCYYFLKSGF